MDYIEKNYEAVKEWLEELDNYDLLNVHRIYCEEANYMDDEVYENDEEFFEIYFPGKVMDAIRATQYGEYDFTDNFVKFDGLGNLESANSVDSLIDVSELAQYIMDNPDEFEDWVELEEIDEDEEDDI